MCQHKRLGIVQRICKLGSIDATSWDTQKIKRNRLRNDGWISRIKEENIWYRIICYSGHIASSLAEQLLLYDSITLSKTNHIYLNEI